ncbi:MAG: hypothetical protein AMJ75_12315, partial [Phycisphaerae bacterium SM1_79]
MHSESEDLKVVIERNVPVPMRDGVILRADVYRPDCGGPYPVLVQRTHYGRRGAFDRFVRAGYIVVSQNVRGVYGSEGEYENFRQLNTHLGEDGYDTIEWAARLPGSNGRVGTFGTSQPAILQWLLAANCPPSLVAMSACSCPSRLTQIELAQGTLLPIRLWGSTVILPDIRRMANRPGVHKNWEAQKLWSEGESEKWINWLPWLELPREVFEDYTELIKHQIMNPHQDTLKLDELCKNISVPNLNVVGWYDHANDDMLLFRTMVREAKTEVARKSSRIIIGPWGHGPTSRRVGKIDFGSDAEVDMYAIRIRWFDYWLKGKQNGIDKDAPVRIFVIGDNKWRDE